MTIIPHKEAQHISYADIIYFGSKRYTLVPGKTLSGIYPVRHRTKLEHPCWFSKKPHIQRLSVAQCIEQHPKYMLWVYKNLSINWSVHVIEKIQKLLHTHLKLFKMANFKEFLSNPLNGGIQYITFFPNGYGCSIVKHSFSYGHELGLWELAVLKGDEHKSSICYDTEITSDVLGYLSEEEVNDIVDRVEKLNGN